MKRVIEERLHDYLDGRLSVEERVEIEELLRQDPQLARLVEEWRDFGRALREGSDELSPGFHARLRERFARSAPGRGRKAWRFLSWEAAGLAAAVLLAAVLFAPEVLRERELAPSSAPAAAAGSPSPRELPASRPADRLEAKTLGRPDQAGAADDAPPIRERQLPESRKDAPAPFAEALQRAAAQEVAPPAGAPVSTFVRLVAEPIALPPGVPAGVQVVEERAIWDAWLAGPARWDLEPLGGYDASRRLVLVGVPAGADCATLSVHVENGSYRVQVGAGPAAGCAFLLPRDGRAVLLDIPAAD